MTTPKSGKPSQILLVDKSSSSLPLSRFRGRFTIIREELFLPARQ